MRVVFLHFLYRRRDCYPYSLQHLAAYSHKRYPEPITLPGRTTGDRLVFGDLLSLITSNLAMLELGSFLSCTR